MGTNWGGHHTRQGQGRDCLNHGCEGVQCTHTPRVMPVAGLQSAAQVATHAATGLPAPGGERHGWGGGRRWVPRGPYRPAGAVARPGALVHAARALGGFGGPAGQAAFSQMDSHCCSASPPPPHPYVLCYWTAPVRQELAMVGAACLRRPGVRLLRGWVEQRPASHGIGWDSAPHHHAPMMRHESGIPLPTRFRYLWLHPQIYTAYAAALRQAAWQRVADATAAAASNSSSSPDAAAATSTPPADAGGGVAGGGEGGSSGGAVGGGGRDAGVPAALTAAVAGLRRAAGVYDYLGAELLPALGGGAAAPGDV